MKWYFPAAALVLAAVSNASAADDLPSAARELARKTAAFLGPHSTAVATYSNRSSLPDSDLSLVRHEFEAALPSSPRETSDSEVRLTLSENATQFLVVEEVRKLEETQTWIAGWSRTALSVASTPGLTLDRKLLWEQEDPILDLASWDNGMLVVSPSRVTLYQRHGTQWIETHHVALALPHPWSRDPRARLRKTGTHIEVFLPGAACEGEAAETLSLNCHPTSDPWVLDSGTRSLLLANFAADRNYFDGKLVLQDGTRRTVPPFYSAAALDDPNGTTWLLALVDGTIELFHPASGTEEPLTAAPWGSDLVAVSACTNGSQILATRGVEGQQPDALQAFSISNRTAHPSAAPLSLEGPIRALWPAGPASALTVIVDPAVHKYRAYAVSLVCGS